MTGTRWLSDEEQRVWRDFLAAVGMLTAHLEHQIQQEGGMPHTYYEVLVALSEAPESTLRMSELAEACHCSRSRLSHAIARLSASGWVRRASCPTDKRGSFAALTDAGLDALQQAAPGHVEAVRSSLFDVLSPEQVASLGEISVAIRENLVPTCAAAAADEHADQDAAVELASS